MIIRLLRAALAFALVLLATAASSPLYAQTGILTGTVIDADFSEGVIGATVVLDGTTLGSATDFDGNYRIQNIPAGTYDVVFSSIGFATQRVTGVEIRAGETNRIDITMSEDVQLLGEVVVEARLIRNNEAALLRDRQNAAAVSDAISAETISKSGASDAADAMERVTGASVVGGKFVVVRGLGDRYSNTQLNGASLPTADPDRRSVQFDLFPSNLLENIVTLKTFTADQPGNFSGGLVDIRTKSFPEAFEVRFSASSGFDTQTQFQDDFLTSPGGGTDLLGFDDGTRELPAFFDAPTPVFNPRQARRDPAQAQQLTDVSRAFGQTFDQRRAQGPINQSYAASLGNRHDMGDNALGYVLSLNWSRSASFYDEGRVERYTYNNAGDDGDVLIRPQLLLDDSRGTEEVSWGGIANMTYRIGSRNEIGLNSLYSRSAEQQSRLLLGFFPEQFDSTRSFVDRTLTYVERDLYSFQFRGRHQMPALSDATFEWIGTLGSNSIDEPDQRFFGNTINVGPDGTRSYSLNVVGQNGQTRFFRTHAGRHRGPQGRRHGSGQRGRPGGPVQGGRALRPHDAHRRRAPLRLSVRRRRVWSRSGRAGRRGGLLRPARRDRHDALRRPGQPDALPNRLLPRRQQPEQFGAGQQLRRRPDRGRGLWAVRGRAVRAAARHPGRALRDHRSEPGHRAARLAARRRRHVGHDALLRSLGQGHPRPAAVAQPGLRADGQHEPARRRHAHAGPPDLSRAGARRPHRLRTGRADPGQPRPRPHADHQLRPALGVVYRAGRASWPSAATTRTSRTRSSASFCRTTAS